MEKIEERDILKYLQSKVLFFPPIDLDNRILIGEYIKTYFKNITSNNDNICINNTGDINLFSFMTDCKLLSKGGKDGEVYVAKFIKINKMLKLTLKVIPINEDEKNNKYSRNYRSWREVRAIKMVSQLVEKRICPNFQLFYGNYICNYCEYSNPYFKNKGKDSCIIILKEYSDKNLHTLIREFSKSEKYLKKPDNLKEVLWKTIFFQIFTALYSMKHFYQLIHGDLHWENILVSSVKETGYWNYIINGINYYIPNTGYTFHISDFGRSVNYAEYAVYENIQKLSDGTLSNSIKNSHESEVIMDISEDVKTIINMYKLLELENIKSETIFSKNIILLLKSIKKKSDYTPGNIIEKYFSEFINVRIGTTISNNDIKKFYKINHPTDVMRGDIVLYYNKENNTNIFACINNISGFHYDLIISVKKNIYIIKKIYYTMIKKSNSKKFQEFDLGEILGTFKIS